MPAGPDEKSYQDEQLEVYGHIPDTRRQRALADDVLQQEDVCPDLPPTREVRKELVAGPMPCQECTGYCNGQCCGQREHETQVALQYPANG